MYQEGVSIQGDLIDLGVAFDVIEKRGAFYRYGDIRLGQGRENAKTFLKEETALAAEIDSKIREQVGLPVHRAPQETEDTQVKAAAPVDDEEQRGAVAAAA